VCACVWCACLGDGVMEYTQLVHNFGEDRFDDGNMPWGGVRPSVYQDILVSQVRESKSFL